MSKKEKLTREQKKEKQRAEYEAMSQKEKDFFDYNKKWHTIGRIWNTIGILLILSVPFVVCFSLKVTPNWTVFGNLGIWTLIIINLGSGISEPVIYAPMLGTNGEYLAFITGNLSNLKVPCALSCIDAENAKSNTDEGDIIATVSTAVSSIVTTLDAPCRPACKTRGAKSGGLPVARTLRRACRRVRFKKSENCFPARYTYGCVMYCNSEN